MKFKLQYHQTIPTLEEANPEEKERIEWGMSKMEEIAVGEMINSFAVSGDTERPLPHSTLELEKMSVVSPDSASSEFMTSALFQFYKGRCMTFDVVSHNTTHFSLRRIEPYLVSESGYAEYNPAFLDDGNVTLLVVAPSDSYITSTRRMDGNMVEVSLDVVKSDEIKSIWSRRGDVKHWYDRNQACLKP